MYVDDAFWFICLPANIALPAVLIGSLLVRRFAGAAIDVQHDAAICDNLFLYYTLWDPIQLMYLILVYQQGYLV